MSKKKWRVKTLEELRATKGAKVDYEGDINKKNHWNFVVGKMSHLIGREFYHDFKECDSYNIGIYTFSKWMCKKVKDELEFKQGEMVEVSDYKEEPWMKREYVCQYKGVHIVLNELGDNELSWRHIRKCE